MKKTATILVVTLLALVALPAFAADGAAIYKAKCQACHGPDGTKNAKANLQGKSADDVEKFIAGNEKHKTRATGDDLKAVAGFVAGLKK